MFRNFNKNLSIKNKIYLGFLGSLLGVVISFLISSNSFNKVSSNFEKLEILNEKVVTLLKLNDLVDDLKRNVSVFVHTGRDSINENVDILLKDVESSLRKIDDSDIFKIKIQNHLKGYSETFKKVVIEYNLRTNLINNKLPRRLNNLRSISDESHVNEIESLIWRFLNSPGGKRSKSALVKIDLLINENSKKGHVKELKDLKKIFLRLVQATRSYLYLVNVVMAGEASEFEYISQEMQLRSISKINVLKKDIQNENDAIQKRFILFFFIFSFLLLFYSWLITKSISWPLVSITKTLNQITTGDVDVLIPEQDRRDEIGTLSKAANTFRERTRSLVRSNEELAQFAYRTSHDLKAPLINIKGLANAALEELKENELGQVELFNQQITEQAEKLEILVNDILSLTRADLQKEEKEFLNLANILDGIKERLSGLSENKNVSIEYDPDDLSSIYVSRSRLTQIIENLVSNAIKYCDLGKENRFVKINVLESQDHFEFSIEDNGLGLPQDHQDKIFEMFQRFHPEAASGSGLGMYIVKKHIEKLNGEISFSSSKDGTRFLIKIPKSVES